MSEFAETLTELFEQLGPIVVRRMFGGYGVYCDGLMFAIVVDDVLFLKTDAATVAAFETAGLEPFVYVRLGKPVQLSFWRAPDALLDDPALAARWGAEALAAARRARAAKPARRRR